MNEVGSGDKVSNEAKQNPQANAELPTYRVYKLRKKVAQYDCSEIQQQVAVLIAGVSQSNRLVDIDFILQNRTDSAIRLDLFLHAPSTYHVAVAYEDGVLVQPWDSVVGKREPENPESILAPFGSLLVNARLYLSGTQIRTPLIWFPLDANKIYQLWFECDSSIGPICSLPFLFSPAIALRDTVVDKKQQQ